MTSTDIAVAAPAAADEVPLPELEDRLCTLAGRVAAATAEFLRLLGEFDRREGWCGPGLRSCAHWLSWRCGMALYTARDHVRVARRLRRLPVTTATFAEGRLSYTKVRAICRVATPATEAELVDVGLHGTASQVERLTRSIESAAPDDVPSKPPPREQPERRLRWEWLDDGTMRVGGRLTAEDGAALVALLQATADARAETTAKPTQTTTEAPEVPTVRSARSGSFSTALVGAASRAGATGLAATQGAHSPTAEVVVHVDADLLTRLRAEGERALARGHLEDGPALALATIERLACDGAVRLSTHGRDGRAIDLGRRTRRPTMRQTQVLMRRDAGCTTPGCGRRRFLHAHHVRPWSRGGPTTMDNLVLLCGEHHRALHAGAFSISVLGRQRFRFRAPDGTVIEYAPELRGRAADADAAYQLVHGDTITPDWHGEHLQPDLLIHSYVRARRAEGDVGDPWSAAA